jgi:spore cortex formation protein SpoVR/YcgB (stage V sporulation)
MSKLLFESNEWNFDMLERCLDAVETIGRQDLGFDLYPNQIEIISSSQMLDAYSSIGMPIMYNHWSFGKKLLRDTQMYRKGQMGLAYEIIINCKPAIAYLMEENTATMQLLVLAHASVGHNFCFANNYMFKSWTDADAIVDYLNFAKKYVNECEEKYGIEQVEKLLDSCHVIMSHGVDKYRRARKLNAKRESERQRSRMDQWEKTQTEMWYVLDPNVKKHKPQDKQLLDEPEENLLYFIEKNSPILKPWQRELVRIVRKISQYYYPQMFTKTLNEGIATFSHYWILNTLYDRGQINDGHMMEWLSSHANVVYQPPYDRPGFSGINPYALGFAIFKDLQRICTQPTSEDKQWFPQLIGEDWKSVIRHAATDYRDDSFVQQWLSPKVARDLKLFAITDDKNDSHIRVNAIHNTETFTQLRTMLANQYDVNAHMPNIMVVAADLEGDRTLKLVHKMFNNKTLDKNTEVVLGHVFRLWGYPVRLQSINQSGTVMHTYYWNS